MNRKKDCVCGQKSIHPHFLRNTALALAILAAIIGAGRTLVLAMLWRLVDISDHLEAWIAAYVISVILTVMAIGFDAAMSLVMKGVFVPSGRIAGAFWRLIHVLLRLFVLGTQLTALVMGAVMAMRLAQAPLAVVMIVLHLALSAAGYLGVRNMESMLKVEQER